MVLIKLIRGSHCFKKQWAEVIFDLFLQSFSTFLQTFRDASGNKNSNQALLSRKNSVSVRGVPKVPQ